VQKKWEVKTNDLKIIFTNEWNLSLNTKEQLIVNGNILSEKSTTKSDKYKDIVMSNHKVKIKVDNNEYIIEIKLGSKWPGFIMGCHIFVNRELIGGDVKSKLMYW
jgi:hypothetical protein